jgi:hypothetical protein
MNFRKINIVTALAFTALVTFTSCSKDDGAIPNRVGIEDVPAVSMNTETGGVGANLSLAAAGTFEGKFKASVYFAGATPPTKIDVMVRKNAASTGVNNANVKTFKLDIAALPANFTVTAAEIEALFGAPLKVKEVYDFGPNIYVKGKKYEAFPATGIGSGQGVAGMSAVGFGEFVRYTVTN